MRADQSFAFIAGLGAAVTLLAYGIGAPTGAPYDPRPRLVADGSAAPAAGRSGFTDCEAMARQMRELSADPIDELKVLVIGSTQEGSPRAGDDELWTPKVVLTLVDTSDPRRPEVLRTARLTGRYVTARLHDGVVRLVFATPPPLQADPAAFGESHGHAVARNMAALRAYDPRNWLPVKEIADAGGRPVSSGPAMGCGDVHPGEGATAPDLLSVLTVDTRRGPESLDRATARAVLGGGDLVYASPHRL